MRLNNGDSANRPRATDDEVIRFHLKARHLFELFFVDEEAEFSCARYRVLLFVNRDAVLLKFVPHQRRAKWATDVTAFAEDLPQGFFFKLRHTQGPSGWLLWL